jgi:hypothetical protein
MRAYLQTMAALRIDIVSETKSLQHSKVEESTMRGFLWSRFLNQLVQPTLLPKVSVVSSSTLVAKEVGVEATPSQT